MATFEQPQILSISILCPECEKQTTCSLEKGGGMQYIICENCRFKWAIMTAPMSAQKRRSRQSQAYIPTREPIAKLRNIGTREPVPKMWIPPIEIASPLINVKFAGRRSNKKSSLQSIRKGLKTKK